MSNLVVRSIAGIVFSVVVIGSACLGQWVLSTIFGAFALIGLYEYYRISSDQFKLDGQMVLGMFGGLSLYVGMVLYITDKAPGIYFFLPGIVIFIAALTELFLLRHNAALNLGNLVFGWIYVILPFGFITWLSRTTGEFQYQLPVGFFAILWTNDTAAYFVGRSFGKHKLFEKVSPKKTWEGLFGGVILSIAAGAGISYFFDAIPSEQWMVPACIIAVVANVGDLFESHIKRTCGVKDSGNIIPGHGGVLDRFDGMLLALPLVIFYLYSINS